MKLVAFLSFLLCLLPSFSQNYCPTVEEGKHWELFYHLGNGGGGGITHEYRIDCDTLLNGTFYNKVLQYGFNVMYLIGFTREDTQNQKVYYLPIDSTQELLVIDYALAVGDTFRTHANYTYTVTSIQTNGNCKTINLASTFGTTLVFDQGYGVLQWGIWNVGASSSPIQIKQFNIVPITCNVTSILPANENIFRAFPNPFTTNINLQTNTNQLRWVKLYNVMGEKLGEYSIKNEELISTQHLPIGVYYLVLDNHFTQKIVKITE
ncbi:MAG: T9SS type A sorting domain-containing protein [Bacteroidia bacterium]